MAEDRLKTWETLFRRALLLIDSVGSAGVRLDDWSFGGGTVLMRRYRHRFSKDVDIFVPDPQYLNYLSPHLNDTADSLTGDYTLQAEFLKLRFPEGEIDFVVSTALTDNPTKAENVLGRRTMVETSIEIVAKKIWHRGSRFRARDVLDLALVAEREPDALATINPILRERRGVVLDWLAGQDRNLREDFANLELLEYRRSYDHCASVVKEILAAA